MGLPISIPDTVTYTNPKTGTTVEVRGGVQVAFAESTKQLETLVRRNPASSPTKILEASGFKLPTGEVKAYIDWQRVQVNSPNDMLFGQAWKMRGTNPYTDAQIIEEATAEVKAYAESGSTEKAPWLKPGATEARVLAAGQSYDVFGNVVQKYASGGYAVVEYKKENLNANGAPVVRNQSFRGKVYHRVFSDGSEEWNTKGIPVSLLGPGAPTASTASTAPAAATAQPATASASLAPARTQQATVSASVASDRELDQNIDSVFPTMGAQKKAVLKKLMKGLMKLLNRESAADGQALLKLLKGEMRP